MVFGLCSRTLLLIYLVGGTNMLARDNGDVALACGLGATIGGLIGHEQGILLALIGVVVGGLIGYLMYDINGVIRALPDAWTKARQSYQKALGWRPNPLLFRLIGWHFLMGFSLCIYLFSCLFGLGAKPLMTLSLFAFGTLVSATLCGFVMAVIFTLCAYSQREGLKSDDLPVARRFALALFPPMVVCWHIPRGFLWLIKNSPRLGSQAVSFLSRNINAIWQASKTFLWALFLKVHSQRRLICLTDAAIGAMVGIYSNKVLLGAIVGAIVGLINNELVTERWLRPHGYIPVRA